jgi:ribonuclease T1
MKRLAELLLVALLLAACGGGAAPTTPPPTPVPTPTPTAAPPTLPAGFTGETITADALPLPAKHTLQLIATGGPYPYAEDGIVFENREGLLPKQKKAYYHEYTVETPGAGDRGPRRIVTGAGGEAYFTEDHYETFIFILR